MSRVRSRSEAIKDILKLVEIKDEDDNVRYQKAVYKYFIKDNIIYTVERIIVKEKNKPRRQHSVICVYELVSTKLFGDLCTWHWTETLEENHPYHFDCPPEYFMLAPVMNKDWRKECRRVYDQNMMKAHAATNGALIHH